MNLVRSLAILAVALAGCSAGKPDPSLQDSGNLDALASPPAPALGAQIDRMGRPAISTALVAVLAAAGPKTARRDLYNQATDPALWKTTMLQTNVIIERELEGNLAVFDAIDKGLAAITGAGCGNAMKYSGPPSPTSYRGAADLFADDQLYVDTSKPACTVYLDLEIEQVLGGFPTHATCGGRTLTHDAIDVTYSILAAGVFGLDQTNRFNPKLHDGVGPHTDVTTTFPFLGAPH